MAIISIDIPTAAVSRIQDAFVAEFGWTSELGVTKTQFTKAQVIEYIKQVTRNYEANLAAGAARATKDTEINALTIT